MAASGGIVEQGGRTAPAGKRIKLPPVGFWSYARQDDYLSQGKLNNLRSLLLFELQQIYGRDEIRLFQDTTTIPHGAAWESEIRTALDQSTFFVAIITPNFIQSEWCCREVALFREREAELRKSHPDLDTRSRILPIHYIDISDVEAADPEILTFLQQLQWFDFRPLRNRSFESEPVREAIAELAKGMRSLLNIRVGDPTTRPRPGPIEQAALPPVAEEAAEPVPPAAPVVEPPHRPADPAAAAASTVAGRNPLPFLLAAVAGLALLVLALLLWPRSTDPGPALNGQSAASPSAAGTAAPRDPLGWLSGRWGVDGDCNDVVTIARSGDSLSVTYGGQPRRERILNLDAPDPNLVVTERARYANASGRRVNVSEAGEVNRMDYFLVPCA